MRAIWVTLTLVALALGSIGAGGCGDATKPAGPGGEREQPYNPKDGRYK